MDEALLTRAIKVPGTENNTIDALESRLFATSPRGPTWIVYHRRSPGPRNFAMRGLIAVAWVHGLE